MKPLLFSLLSFLCTQLCAQQQLLYYFSNKAGLIGVKNSSGKVIIPAKHYEIDCKAGEQVQGNLINLIDASDTLAKDRRNSWGKVYDRNGQFLYRPYMFDNGPDEYHEGLRRFVENGKIGFVDRQGEKVIPAKYDFVTWFELGTASFCMGCYFDTKKDMEHPPLKGGLNGIINKKGEILADKIAVADNKRFAWYDSLQQKIYPSQFSYTAREEQLIARFEPYRKEIEKEYFSNDYYKDKSCSLLFDIVERPSPGFDYYVIDTRQKIGGVTEVGWERLQFYISKNGRHTYYHEWGQLVPFQRWYDRYTKGERNFDGSP